MLYLLDGSAVLNDFSFSFFPEHGYFVTPLVMAEFRDMRSRHLAENALQRGLLQIKEPCPKSLERVRRMVSEKGFSRLSKADLSLLALALDLKGEGKRFRLVTDDYSIQNFCSLLSIPFDSVIRGKVSGVIFFSFKCVGCGKRFRKVQRGGKCPECGSPLKAVRMPEKPKNKG